MNKSISQLQYLVLKTYSDIRDKCMEVIEVGQTSNPELANLSLALLYYYSERCQSMMLMLQQNRLWDCEIIFRSALECSTRLIFVCIAEADEQKSRINEFWDSLFEVESLALSEKAKKVIESNKDEIINAMIGSVILSSADEEKIRKKWTSKQRQKLNQKWSFSGMVKEISSYQQKGLDLSIYPTLLYGYNISSHLIHSDRIAITWTWDRNNNRESNELELIENAHVSRLLTDQITVLVLCLRVISIAFNFDIEQDLINNAMLEIYNLTKVHHQDFYESQRDLYE